jgi:hypothetical protein
MENRPLKPVKAGKDAGSEPKKETRLSPKKTAAAPSASKALGSTRVLTSREEEILANHEKQQLKPAIPIGQEGSVLADFQIVKKLGAEVYPVGG